MKVLSDGLTLNGSEPGRSASEGGLRLAASGAKLAACLTLSVAAVAVRGTASLTVLTTVNLLLALAYGVGARDVLRGARALAIQTGIITSLYLIRYGAGGILSGLMVSWQLYLAFLPGVVFLRSTPQHQITGVAVRLLPQRTAFVLSASIGMIPRLVREIRSIYEIQLLRGARIRPRDIYRPASWPDFVHCLLVPSIVKGMALSGELAVAARARGFGETDKRTCWLGQ